MRLPFWDSDLSYRGIFLGRLDYNYIYKCSVMSDLGICDINRFSISCLRPLSFLLPKLLNYFERTWWTLSQKGLVLTQFDIYVFIKITLVEKVQARLNFLFYSTFQSRKKGCLVLNQVVSNLRWNWEKNVISVNGLINYF
jgi:hypothetical protein